MSTLNVKGLSLVERDRDGKVVRHSLNETLRIQAKPGAHYTLISDATQKPPARMVLKRKGQSLLIEQEGQEAAEILDFYSDQAASFATDGSMAPVPGSNALVTAATPPVAVMSSGEFLVWTASDSALAAVGLIAPEMLAVAIAGGVAVAAGGGGDDDGGVTVDTTPPVSPSGVVLSPSDDGAPASDRIIRVALAGDAKVGDKVVTVVYLNRETDEEIGTVETVLTQADLDNGYVDQSISAGLFSQEGTYLTKTHLVDAAGNVGADYTNNATFIIFNGLVHDDYIANAQVFVDRNNDGDWDPGEPVTTTDGSGRFSFAFNPNGAPVLAVGGIDTASGTPNNSMVFKAYGGDLEASALGVDIVLSPLTTLIAAIAEQVAGEGQAVGAASLQEAAILVNSVLGLGVSDPLTLLTFDPVEAASATDATGQDVDLLTVNRQLAIMLSATGALIDGAATDDTGSGSQIATNALAGLMLERDEAQEVFDFAASQDVTDVLQAAMDAANEAGVTEDLRATDPADLALLGEVIAEFNDTVETAATTEGAQSTEALAAMRTVSDYLIPLLEETGTQAESDRGGDISLADVVADLDEATSGGGSVASLVENQIVIVTNSLTNETFETNPAAGYVGDLIPLNILLPAVGLGDTVDTLTLSGIPDGVTLYKVNPLTGEQTALLAVNGVYTIEPADVGYLAVQSATPVSTPPIALTATNTVDSSTTTYTGSLALSITAAPTISVASIAALSDDRGTLTGALNSGDSTDDDMPALSGTLSASLNAGEVVKIYDGATLLGEAIVTGQTWTFTPSLALSEGSHSLSARVETSRDLISASRPFTFTVDTTAPAAPTINPSSGLVVTGYAEPGAQVALMAGTTTLGTATADSTGQWVFTPTSRIADGTTLTAKATDSAGNESGSSSSRVVDAGVPGQIVTLVSVTDDVTQKVGALGNGDLTNDATPSLAGTLSAALGTGESVKVYDGNTEVGTAVVTGTAWSFTPSVPLSEGLHSLTLRVVRSLSGGGEKLGAATQPYDITVDSVAPAQTVIVTSITDDVPSVTGAISSSIPTNDAKPGLSGTLSQVLASGEALVVYDGQTRIGVATVSATSWTFTPGYSLADGAHNLTFRVEDGAGNVGATSVPVTFTIDTVDPAITSGATAAAINENSGAGQVIYTASATDTADISGSVSYSLKTNNSDDAASFTINSTTGAVTLTGNPDRETKASYSFTVVATDAAGNATEKVVSLAISNADAPVALAVSQTSIQEGSTGTTTDLVYTASRTLTTGAGAVAWALTGSFDSNDLANGQATSGTVSFSAGQASQTFTITVLGDKTLESDDTLTVTLSNPTGDIALGTPVSTSTTVLTDDGEVSVAVNHASLVEGNLGTSQTLLYTVTRTNSLAASSVDWTLTGVDASDLANGTAMSGTVSFAAGQASQVLTITVLGDKAVEGDESLQLTLSNPGGNLNLATSSASTTLSDDDSLISVQAVRASTFEGANGETQAAVFRITRANPESVSSVDWAISGVDASDLGVGQATSGTVSFSAGQAEQLVTVTVKGDSGIEADETLTLTLSNAGSNAVLGVTSAGTVLVNDDIGYAIEAFSTHVTEGANGAQTPVVFRVLRSDSSGAASVDYRLIGVGSEAVDGQDFVGGNLPSGTVSFGNGVSAVLVTLQVAGDAIREADEQFSIVLENPSSGRQILQGEIGGSLGNDDNLYNITAVTNATLEGTGTGGVQQFVVTRSGNTAAAGTVGYSIAGYADNAASGNDFTSLTSGTVSFAAGVTATTLAIDLAGDSQLEGYEAYKVGLSAGSNGNAEIGRGVALATINPDDVGISIVANNAVTFEDGGGQHTFNVYRTGYLGGTSVVNWSVQGYGSTGYVTDSADFAGTFPSGSLTFAAGVSVMEIAFTPNADVGFENNEGYQVVLTTSQPGVILLDDRAEGMLQNDESGLTLQAVNLDRMEGNPGETPEISFRIDRTGNNNTVSVVRWTLSHDASNGTSAGDFAANTAFTGLLTFAVGESAKLVSLPLSVDEIIEADKHFTVSITSQTVGTEVLVGQVSGVIRNDDAQFALQPLTSVSEGDGGSKTVTLTVLRTGDLTGSDTVQWSVGNAASGTSTSAADFNGGTYPNGTLLFTASETTKTITLSLNADSVLESDEAFTVTLSNNSNGTTIASNGTAQTVTITNDDDRLSIAATDASKAEGGSGTTDFVFTVTREGFLDKSTSIGWSVAGNGANQASAADFGGTLPSGTVSFAANQSVATIAVSVLGENLNELDEGFRITLGTPPAGTEVATGSANGSIINDDTGLAIAATTTNLAEGDSGTVDHVFTITRSGVTTGSTTVDWAASGTADATDFGGTLPSGTVSFAAGETVQTITLQASGDATIESTEGFTVTLSNARSNADIQVASASGSIVADDIGIAITASPASTVVEGASGSSQVLSYTVTRSGDTASAVVVDWAATGMSADDFANGTALSGSLTFAAGQTSKVINLTLTGDNVLEADDTLTLTLSKHNGDPEFAQTYITTATPATVVQNDDVKLAIVADVASRPEGDTATTTPYTFTITPTGVIGANRVVAWRVQSAQAATNDFVASQDAINDNGGLPSGYVTFAAGQTAAIVVTVNVAGDIGVEPDESFSVVLSTSAANVELGTASATATIANDDTSYSIVALSADKNEGNSGSTDYTFNVIRSGVANGTATINWAVTGAQTDGADAADFGSALPTGTVTFTGTEATQTITISVAGDTVVENDEGFVVTLSNVSPDKPITTATATGSIRNEDQQFSVAAANTSLNEGDSGSQPLLFTVTRTGDTRVAGTVQYALTGGTGVDGSDYAGTLPAGTLTFGVSETTKLISVSLLGDSLAEGDETFTLTLTSPGTNATLGTSSASTTLVNKDVALEISAPANANEGNTGGSSTPFVFTVTRSGAVNDGATVVDWVVNGSSSTTTQSDFTTGQDGLTTNAGLPSGKLTFAASETTQLITVSVAQDVQVELSETITVVLQNPTTSNVELRTASATATVQADDSGYSIAAVDAIKTEADTVGSTAHVFSITRAGDLSGSAVAHWAVSAAASGNSADVNDFGGNFPSGDVTFVANDSVKYLTVTATGDLLGEYDEGFTVTLSNVPGIVDATAAGRILNDDQSFSVSGATSVAEGNSGTQLLTFTVGRAGDMSGTATVAYALTGGTGVTAADYTGSLPSGVLTFAANVNAQTVTLAVNGDTLAEADESYTLTLTNPTGGATFGADGVTSLDASTTVTNDDTNYALIAPASAYEGASSSTPVVFTITRTGVTSGTGSVQWKLQSANYLSTADFTGSQDALASNGDLPSGTVSFVANSTVAYLTINVAGDTTLESDETLQVVLSSPLNGTLQGTDGDKSTVVLTDDDSFSIATVTTSRAEGNSDSTVTYTVTRTGSLTGARELTWTITGVDGFSTSTDLATGQASTGTVTFAADKTSASIVVNIKGDSTVEGTETMTVTLSGAPANSTITTASASTDLTNDDVGLSITSLLADKNEGNIVPASTSNEIPANNTSRYSVDSSGVAQSTLEINGDVDWIRVNLTAGHTYIVRMEGSGSGGGNTLYPPEINGIYNASGVSLGYSASTFTGTPQYTAQTSFTPSTSGIYYIAAAGHASLYNGIYTLRVTDQTTPGADVSAPDVQAYTFTLTRTGDTSQASTAEWRVVQGVGVDATDFRTVGSQDLLGGNGGLPSGSVSFAASEVTKILTVNIATDHGFESDEILRVVLSNASVGTEILTASADGFVRNDDAELNITAGTASRVEGDAGHGTGVAYTYTVTRTGYLNQVTTANWSVEHIATDSNDFSNGVGSYLTPSGTLNFDTGVSVQTVTVYAYGDTGLNSIETDETFRVVLSKPNAGASIGATNSYTSTIVNDDTNITVTLDDMRVPEKVAGQSSTYTATLVRTGDVNKVSTLNWEILTASIGDIVEGWDNNGGGADATDFAGTFPTGAVTFGVSDTTKTITFSVSGDDTPENDEWFRVYLSGATGNDQITTVYYDSRVSNGTQVFYDHQASYGDSSTYYLTNGTQIKNATVGYLFGEIERDEAIYTVLDKEVVSASDRTLINSRNEGDTTADGGSAGTTVQHIFAVQRTISLSGDSWVTWRVVGDHGIYTPAVASDFAAGSDARSVGALASGTLSFVDGQEWGYITVSTVKDDAGEYDEGFRLYLDGVAGGSSINTYDAGGYNQNIGWLNNDDTRFDAMVGSNVVEGNSLVYTITRNGDWRGADTVTWSFTLPGSETTNESNATPSTWYKLDMSDIGAVTVSDGSVTSNASSWTGTMTFADGERTKTITVTTTDDAWTETWREELPISLTSASNVNLSEANHDLETAATGSVQTGWVLDNEPDSLITVGVNKTSEFEGTSSGNTVVFTVYRSNQTDETTPTAPNYSTTVVWKLQGDGLNSWDTYSNVAAVASFVGTDVGSVTEPYSDTTYGTLTFLANETAKYVTVTYSPDAYIDTDDRTLTFSVLEASTAYSNVHLSNDNYGPTNLAGSNTSVTTILRNDDIRLWVNGWDTSSPYNNLVRIDSFEGTASTFVVNRAGRLDSDIVLSYTVTNGTSAAADFGAGTMTGSLTLTAQASHSGSYDYTFSLTNLVANDALVETNETFTLTLSAPVDTAGSTVKFSSSSSSDGYSGVSTTLGLAGTIYDTDTTYTLTPTTSSQPETDISGTATYAFTVARSGTGYTGGATVYWKVVVDGNLDAADFATGDTQGINNGLPSGTVTFNSGDTDSSSIQVLIAGDLQVEANGTFHVVIYQDVLTQATPNVTNTQNISSSVVTVTNDDTGISIADASLTESDASQTLVFTVTRSGDLSGTSTMNWTVGYPNGQASAADLTGATSGALTYAANDTTKLITVTVVGDTTPEASEQFTVTLSNFQGTSAVDDQIDISATGTINNDDSSFAVSAGSSAFEGAGQVFTVTRSHATVQNQVVSWAVSGPTNGALSSDFGGTFPSGAVTFSGSALTQLVTITSNADTTTETDEDFTATFTLGTGTTGDVFTANSTATQAVTGTIVNNDANYALTANQDNTVMEGHSGNTPRVYTVTRSGYLANAATVDWAVSGAAVAADFAGGVLPSGTVSFAANVATAAITVQVAGDTATESDEAFTLTISNAQGADGDNITTATQSTTITNDDSDLSIVALSADKAEGDSATTAYTFNVIRTGYLGSAAIVNYAVSSSSADSSDFNGMSGTLNLPASQGTVTLTILVNGDTDPEGDEGFTVTLSSASTGVNITGATANGTIQGDDIWFDVSAPAPISEGTGAGNTTFPFVVTRTGDLDASQELTWTVAGSGSNPTSGSDFAATTGLITFAVGATAVTIGVPVVQDQTMESDETFTLTLSNPTPSTGVHFTHTSAEATIIEDEVAFRIAPTSVSHPEGSTTATDYVFTVTRSGNTSGTDSVAWTFSGGTGVDGSDFVGGSVPAGGTLTFSPTETTKLVTVQAAADSILENDETFTISLASNSAGTFIVGGAGSSTATIANDDSTVAITALDAAKVEGHSGTTAFTFNVVRTGNLDAQATVAYTVSGTNVTAADFSGLTNLGGTLTLPANQATTTLTILVQGDRLAEQDEPFTVTLSSPSDGVTVTMDSASGTIQADDVVFDVTAPANAAEGGTGDTTPFNFVVTRDGKLTGSQVLSWTVQGVGNDATTAADFVDSVTSGLVTFTVGQMVATIGVQVKGDYDSEPDETFRLSLAASSGDDLTGVAFTHQTADATILNDEASFYVAATDTNKVEGASGTVGHVFTITRTGNLALTSTVEWAVANGSTDADDYDGVLGSTLTFAAGNSVHTVTVYTKGDTVTESDEGFTVSLSNASTGANIITGTANGSIVSDDVAWTVATSSIPGVEGDGNSSYVFSVVRTGSVAATSIDWSVAGSGTNTATADDFSTNPAFPSGNLVFGQGDMTQFLTVVVAGDSVREADESFTVTLTAPADSQTHAYTQRTAEATIVNDDDVMSIAALSADKAEGSSGTTAFTFTVTRDGSLAGSSTVGWQVVNGTTESADFSGTSGSVTFANNQSVATVTVNVVGDRDVELDQGFSVQLVNAGSGSTIDGVNHTATATIRNDDVDLALAAATASATEGDIGTAGATTFTVTRSGDLSVETMVNWAVVAGSGSGSATAADFDGGSLPGGTLTFAASETVKTITVSLAGDGLDEGNEAFTVQLSGQSSHADITANDVAGSIVDDDDTLTVSAFQASASEGASGAASNYVFQVVRTGTSTGVATVDWQVAGSGTHALDASEFVATTGSVSFANGDTTRLVTVQVNGDAVGEYDETFTISLTNPSYGSTAATATATGTVLNDDAALFISANTPSGLNEGVYGAETNYVFTVVRTGDQSGSSTANWQVEPSGSYPANALDFGGAYPSGIVAFAAGVGTQMVTVTVMGDAVGEFDESFAVRLSNAVNATIVESTASSVILNDDTGISIAAQGSVEKLEGHQGATTDFVYRVARVGLLDATTVNWQVVGAGDYQVAADDFVGGTTALPSGVISFAASEAYRDITLQVAGDDAYGPDEGFRIVLSGNANLINSEATGLVRNDDSVVAISASTPSLAEGDAGNTAFVFAVTRSGATSQTAVVGWTVAGSGGHAADATDFGSSLPSGTVTFAATETTRLVTVAVSGDNVAETDEAFTVQLSATAGSGVMLDPTADRASATIIGDDQGVLLFGLDVDHAEGQVGSNTTYTYQLIRTGDTSQALTVNYAVTGTGIDATDFVSPLTGTISMAAGVGSTILTLTARGDASVELDETFQVALSGNFVSPTPATGVIRGDEDGFSVVARQASQVEGGAVVFDIVASGLLGSTVVNWSVPTSALDSVEAADFPGSSLPSGRLTFTTDGTQSVTVQMADDAVVELDESVTLSLTTSGPVSLTDAARASTVVSDNDVATSSAQVIEGNDTADILYGLGGADTVNAGGGDDVVVFNANNLNTFTALNGGAGIDTLFFDAGGQSFDLTAITSKLSSVEKLDISGTGANTLQVSGSDLAGLLANVFDVDNDPQTTGTLKQLMIDGDANDTVQLVDVGWTQGSQTTQGGQTYAVWSTAQAQLLIETGVTVQQSQP